MEKNFICVSNEFNLEKKQIENTYKLYKDGATIAFISRYRKELTGQLDEDTIRNVIDRLNYLENLDKRKEEVIRLIEEQGKLSEDLKNDILEAMVLQKVEDLYLPYKKKKKTKADIAKEQGLEELAKLIIKGIKKEELEEKAKSFINEMVINQNDAIEKACLIIAQDISENIKIREYLRKEILEKAFISSSLIEKNKNLDEKLLYKDYYDFSSDLKTIKTHNILALNRAEKEKILKLNISFLDKDQEKIYRYILNNIFKKRDEDLNEFYYNIVLDSYNRLLFPSIENEARNILTEKAEQDAIKVFSKNLESLLLQAPLYKKTILGLDPGIRTGCKLAIISSEGFYIDSDVIYPVDYAHSEKQLEISRIKLKEYIKKYKVDIIAIGNGTASRETEKFVAENIKGLDVKYVIVNEAGASVYSASKLAAEEFPKLDVTVRGTISIARRIQDPLSELVKIDPKSIGVGMYQHDVNQKELNTSLEETIIKIVNKVGVNLNTASYALLSYVSGVKKNIAKNIVEYRRENGDFKDRKTLLKVKGLGEKAYEQMAGFIVIPESKNPFDNTIIHPESYELAEKILNLVSSNKEQLHDDYKKVREKLSLLSENEVIEKMKTSYGIDTIKDVYNALLLDRRDPRDSYPQPMLKSDILNIEDLKEGMELEAVVRNVAKFGVFVDIGLKNDAMIHISELSDKFIKDPSDILSVGDIIKVRVLSIDKDRNRVALTRKNR